jgi:hypothetical protein
MSLHCKCYSDSWLWYPFYDGRFKRREDNQKTISQSPVKEETVSDSSGNCMHANRTQVVREAVKEKLMQLGLLSHEAQKKLEAQKRR